MKSEISSTTHLKNLTTKRDALKSELLQGRAELKTKLQSEVILNGEGARFAELEQQIKSLDEAIVDCEGKAQDERNEQAYLKRRDRISIYNSAASKAQEAALVLDEAAVSFAKAIARFFELNNNAGSLGAEFGASGRRILERDFHSVLTQLHPIFREALKLQRNVNEQRKSFSCFAASAIPDERKLQTVNEINGSGWFELLFSDNQVLKVARSRLNNYLTKEQLGKLPQ